MAENADGSKSGETYINWNFVDVFAHFKLTDILYIVQTIYIYIKIKRRQFKELGAKYKYF